MIHTDFKAIFPLHSMSTAGYSWDVWSCSPQKIPYFLLDMFKILYTCSWHVAAMYRNVEDMSTKILHMFKICSKHILDISRIYLLDISGKYVEHILGISRSYLWHIVDIFWAHLLHTWIAVIASPSASLVSIVYIFS